MTKGAGKIESANSTVSSTVSWIVPAPVRGTALRQGFMGLVCSGGLGLPARVSVIGDSTNCSLSNSDSGGGRTDCATAQFFSNNVSERKSV